MDTLHKGDNGDDDDDDDDDNNNNNTLHPVKCNFM